MKEFVKDKNDEIRGILYEIDQMKGVELDDCTYDSAIKYINHAYIHGVEFQLRE